MFCLVLFSDGSSGIYPIKSVTMLSGKTCLVKHKGTKYEATVTNMHETKQYLEDILNASSQMDLPTPNTTSELCNLEDVSIGTEYVDCNRMSNSLSSCYNFNESEIYRSLDELENGTENNSTDAVTTNNVEEERPNSGVTDFCSLNALGNYDYSNPPVSCLENDVIETSTRDRDDEEENEPLEFQDDSYEDPNYSPSSESSKMSSVGRRTPSFEAQTHVEEENESCEVSGPEPSQSIFSQENTAPLNDKNLKIEKSRGRAGDKKFSFCLYCNTKQQKIARHLEEKHKNESEVKSFLVFPKGNPRRRQIIGSIRKKGNFIYNTRSDFNEGDLIVSRRPFTQKNAGDYAVCSNCKGYYSKATLRTHFQQCTGRKDTLKRTVLQLSRRVAGKVHQKASEAVRKYLLPVMRDDDIVSFIRYDELLIIYANKMCEKYREIRHYEMIRHRLRLLGRFFLILKEKNSCMNDFASMYDAKYIDDVLQSINVTSRFNERTCSYETPSVAFSLSTLIKQCGSILITECIKKHEDTKKKDVKDFLKIFAQEVNININRTVAESQLKIKRKKKVELPTMADIKVLRDYLLKLRDTAMSELKKKVTFSNWLSLAEPTLILIQLFNRRRAGELERIHIEDFENYQTINEKTNEDLFKSLSVENKNIAKKYVRFVIRGKRNRTVPVLLDTNLLECVQTIISNRQAVGVSTNNPYVFGLPGEGENQFTYLRACNLLRRFSEECGANNPTTLRGTHLRKHIATTCITLNLAEHEISDLANFMGHQDKIHKDIYRQPIVSREILKMSKLLEYAQGAEDSESEEEMGDGDDYDVENREGLTAESVRPSTTKSAHTPVTKKRKTMSYGSVKRTKWTEEERHTVSMAFGNHISEGTLPSLKDIQTVIREHPELQNRTPPQVKTWISNQHRLKKKLSFNTVG